jgi:hypothetical protein
VPTSAERYLLIYIYKLSEQAYHKILPPRRGSEDGENNSMQKTDKNS